MGRPTIAQGLQSRPRALLLFALSSPFHFSHPDSPPDVERARANPPGKERAKERAKTEIGDTGSHPEIRRNCLIPAHFDWSRLGDLNPGPTHYEPFAAPLSPRSYSCIRRLTPASSAIHAPYSGAYPGHSAPTPSKFALGVVRHVDALVPDGIAQEVMPVHLGQVRVPIDAQQHALDIGRPQSTPTTRPCLGLLLLHSRHDLAKIRRVVGRYPAAPWATAALEAASWRPSSSWSDRGARSKTTLRTVPVNA